MEDAPSDTPDRRGTRRRCTFEEHGIVGARVRPGYHASVVDVSSDGALIETAHRLLPGLVVELHLERPDLRAAIRGRVIRCAVASVGAGSVSYRGAIRFEGRLAWFTDGVADGYSVPRPELLLSPDLGEAATPDSASRSQAHRP